MIHYIVMKDYKSILLLISIPYSDEYLIIFFD